MEQKTHYESYKETGFLDLQQNEIVDITEILENDFYEVHEKLVQLRAVAGLNQQQLAEILNVSQSAISQWEKGTKRPSAEVLLLLADLYEYDIKEFMVAFGFTFLR